MERPRILMTGFKSRGVSGKALCFLLMSFALCAEIACRSGQASAPISITEPPASLFPICQAARRCGYIDATGRTEVPFVYLSTSVFYEGLGKVQSANRKYGFVDESGKMLIPAMYDDAGDFHEHMARVTLHGKSGFIDPSGNWKIQPSILSGPRALPAGVGDFSDGLAFILELGGRQGWIDKTGNLVVPMPREDANHWNSAAGDFGDGRMVLQSCQKQSATGCVYGYMDKTGKAVIPPQFAFENPFVNGLAAVEQGVAPKMWGYIDPAGKQVIGFQFTFGEPFYEGFAAAGRGQKCGYINSGGQFVIQPIYDTCGKFSNGLAGVVIGGKSGFIDTKGAMVIAPQFDPAGGMFRGKVAVVAVNHVYEYVDRSGKVIAQSRFPIPSS